MSKVFFIGYNKTATYSLHKLFSHSGYKSCHANYARKVIALTMKENFESNKPLLTNLEGPSCYLDIVYCDHSTYVEANQYFKTLDEQYPNSYFVLQTRNVDEWIKSRMNHMPKKPFSERAMSALNLKNEEDLINYWKDLRENHYKEVRNYFKNNNRYVEFDIDNDDISKLIRHVRKDFTLKEKHWGRHNVTKGRK